MGATVIQAANWRLVAVAELGLLLLASIGMIILGVQPKAIPHLVLVDKLGAATYAGALDRAALQDFKPPPASFTFHLRRFVSDTCEISSDVAIVRRNWIDATASSPRTAPTSSTPTYVTTTRSSRSKPTSASAYRSTSSSR
jgi:type IV secretion system protein VirB5